LPVTAHPRESRQVSWGLGRPPPSGAAAVDCSRAPGRETGTPAEPMGGGYWLGDRRLVMLRGTQEEAAGHELAHAWWDSQREAQRDALMGLLRELGARPPAAYPRIAELAAVYCHGIKTQKDPTSPTG